MNVLRATFGNLVPLMVNGASVLAAMSSAMLLHIDQFNNRETCGVCAFTMFSAFAVAAWLGVFVILRWFEEMMDQSAGVLKDIEEEIESQATESICFHGGQRVRRHRAGRLFQRRPLRLKIGEFRNLEPGFAMEFFQSTEDNIITYGIMVDFSGKMGLL